MDGVLVIDKPAGVTSHDVVDTVRRALQTKKVGHAGTLDPDATGVLLIGVGRATRFLSYAQAAPKRYTAVAHFGAITSTQDASGDILEKRPADIDRDSVAAALEKMRGEIEQVPPMVSAVKVGGERLYRKARRGEDVDRPARRVTIYELELTGFDAGPTPAATLDVRCSAGTYVRTLVHDLGLILGCGAYLYSLRRTEAGGFSIAEAMDLGSVTPDALRPLLDAVRELPVVEIGPESESLVTSGRPLDALDALASPDPVAITRNGRLLAVYRRHGESLVADRVVG
jgi:tRNA pseudouridine55 synthase